MKKTKKTGKKENFLGKIKKRKNLYRVLMFFVRLNILAIPLYLVLQAGYQSAFLMDATTVLAYRLVKASMPAEMQGGIITIPVENGVWGARVSWDSTGWKSMLAVAALIFATDFPFRKKALGLVLIPLVYAANVLRIWLMFFAVRQYGIEYFSLFHTVIWSWGLIFTILVLWVAWMKYFPDKFTLRLV